MLLTNFVFMFYCFFLSKFPCLAFFDSPLLRNHFWPFTQVLRKIWLCVTRKDARTVNCCGVKAERSPR